MNTLRIAIARLNLQVGAFTKDWPPIKSFFDQSAFGTPIKTVLQCLFLLALIVIISPSKCLAQDDPLVPDGTFKYTPQQIKSGLKHLRDIATKDGVNDVSFDGADEAARIAVAHRYGTDSSQHSVFFTNTQDETYGWIVTPVGINEDETIEDEFDDGYYFKAVRFMNGYLDGEAETFLFIATLEGSGLGTPSPTATIVVDAIRKSATVGFQFLPILQFRTTKRYDDADEALLGELNIPLPIGYKPAPGE